MIDTPVTLADPDSYFELLEKSANEHWWSNGLEFIERKWIQNELIRRNSDSLLQCNWLDVGCGTGLRLGQWSDWPFWKNRVGVEPDRLAMNGIKGDDSMTLIKCGLPGLPFSTPLFDLVTGFDVIQHVSKLSRERALSELFRVIKPGGLLFLRTNAPGIWGDPDCDESIVSSAEMIGFLIRNHFKIIQSSHFNMVGGLVEEVAKRYGKKEISGDQVRTAFKTGLPRQWQIRPKGHPVARLVGWLESRIAGTGLVKIPFGHSYLVMACKEVDHE